MLFTVLFFLFGLLNHRMEEHDSQIHKFHFQRGHNEGHDKRKP
jgi:hypothetical protein